MFREIKSYTQHTKSFHMPGHKGGKLSLIQNIYQLDVTEVEGTDDLHHPTGIIKEVQDYISQVYGSGKSYMLVNGSTGGILAAISSVVNSRDRIIIGRNCHKSVYNSVFLNALDPIYLYPEINQQYGFFEQIDPEVLESLLATNIDAKAVVITSPTYEGIVSDIKQIAEITHRFNKILIVDEAHGAHFTYSDYLPQSALELGADIVIHSTHKTLPSLTQTGLIHVSKEAIQTKRVHLLKLEKYLSIYQTSSPSYVLMTSIEASIHYMEEHKTEYSDWLFELEETMTKRDSKYGRWLFEIKDVKYIDVTRLTFLIHDSVKTMTGWKLSKLLRELFNIQVELSSESYIIAITTIADELYDIVEFMNAIELCFEHHMGKSSVIESPLVNIKDIINNVEHFIESQMDKSKVGKLIKPKQVYSIYETSMKDFRSIGIQESIGKVAVDFIIPYPPGIPVLVPGEEISQEIVDYINYLIRNNMEVYGIIKGAIMVVD